MILGNLEFRILGVGIGIEGFLCENGITNGVKLGDQSRSCCRISIKK